MIPYGPTLPYLDKKESQILFKKWLLLLYKSLKKNYLFMTVLGLHCCMGFPVASRGCSLGWCTAFSLWQLLLRLSKGFGARGLSSCPSQPLERRISCWRSGLAAPRYVRSSQTRDRTCVSCISRWILYH